MLSGIADHSDKVRAVDERAYQLAIDILFEVRKQRSEAKQPFKVPITRVAVNVPAESVQVMSIVEADLRAALRVQAFDVRIGDGREVLVEGYETVPQT